jgi:hypothetical protein
MTSLGKTLAALAATLVSALGAQAQKAPDKAAPPAKAKSACNAIADEAACKADATCTWVAASVDKATGKQKRKAYCKSKPKAPAKKKPPEPPKK